MRVVVFGATGRIGSCVVAELLHRGHEVSAVARTHRGAPTEGRSVKFSVGDATVASNVARLARGHDAAVSAIGPSRGQPPSVVVHAADALVEGLRRAHVGRLIVVGGAGSLTTPSGRTLLETPEFPESGRPVAKAHREALEHLRDEPELEWTYLSPAANLRPGARTGRYRTGSDLLLVNERGESSISFEDLAVAIVDELETPRHVRRRFTVASV